MAEDLIGDDRMSSFKVQVRWSGSWSIDLALPEPRRWVNVHPIVAVTATLRRAGPGLGRELPGQPLSFAVTRGPNTTTGRAACASGRWR